MWKLTSVNDRTHALRWVTALSVGIFLVSLAIFKGLGTPPCEPHYYETVRQEVTNSYPLEVGGITSYYTVGTGRFENVQVRHCGYKP